jgi:hypothetical protein
MRGNEGIYKINQTFGKVEENYSGTSISRTSRETKKKYSSKRNTFFLLIFQLNLHQAYVL